MGGDLREGGRVTGSLRAERSKRNRNDRVREEEREVSERSPLSLTVPVRRLCHSAVDFTALL